MTMSLFRTFVRHFSFTNMLKDKVGILGVPFDKGQPLFGVALGPDAIRGGGLLENMKEFCKYLNINNTDIYIFFKYNFVSRRFRRKRLR